MPTQPIESRVDSLEDRVTQLEQQIGPDDRDPSQVLPLRTEMRAEFSAVHARLGSIDARFESIDARFESIDARFDRLESKIDQQGTQMRVLHEEVITRIALLGEGARPSARKRRKT